MQSDSNLTIGYHYDHEHKYFDGEIPVQYDPFNPKKFILPDNVTLKAPPPTPEGYIAVYDETRNLWKVVPDTFNRTVLFRITYRHNDNDFPQGIPQISTKIASGTFLNLGENKLSGAFHEIKNFDRYISSDLICFSIAYRLRHINNILNFIYRTSIYSNPQEIHSTAFHYEEIIYEIKKIIDIIITLMYIKTTNDNLLFDSESKIEVDSLGKVLNLCKSKKWTKSHQNFIKKINLEANFDFLYVINDIHNSYKHSILSSTYLLEIFYDPTVVAHTFKTKMHAALAYEIPLRKIIFWFEQFIFDLIGEEREVSSGKEKAFQILIYQDKKFLGTSTKELDKLIQTYLTKRQNMINNLKS